MGRRSRQLPQNATCIKTYAEFQELIAHFALLHFDLLAIVGRPGLSKSKSLKVATEGLNPLVIKGRKSAIDLYTDLYHHQDKPVILDDADNLIGDRLCREYVKALTETDKYKRLDWGTKTKLLLKEGVPSFFHTESKVCIIANFWNTKDPLLNSLESRAEFIAFDPGWIEVYRQVSTWFWDQEIFDYVGDRLGVLREPDCRLFVKAYNRKTAGMKRLTWQALIDAYVDDTLGLHVRKLLADRRYKTNNSRAEAFKQETGADRSTFYRRMADLKRYVPEEPTPRIKLQYTQPPEEERPADGIVVVPTDEDDDRGYRVVG